jgi:hypothetical protein
MNSLKMAEFGRNMQQQTNDCIVMHIRLRLLVVLVSDFVTMQEVSDVDIQNIKLSFKI